MRRTYWAVLLGVALAASSACTDIEPLLGPTDLDPVTRVRIRSVEDGGRDRLATDGVIVYGQSLDGDVALPAQDHKPCRSLHGATATDPDGRVWTVCETQPRVYTTPDGRSETVIDRYLQSGACPTIPIQ